MLVNAKLYEKEIDNFLISNCNNLFYQFISPDWVLPQSLSELEGTNILNFVSIGEGGVQGFISFERNLFTKAAEHWILFNTTKENSYHLILDLHKLIHSLFTENNFNRIEWNCYIDNPCFRGYHNFISKCNGTIAGIYHQRNLLMDGQLHDSVAFEILKEQYLESKMNRRMVEREAQYEILL